MTTANDLVAREVGHCVSGLVSVLALGGRSGTGRDVADLMEQATELAAPIDDWEEAATQAGWEESATRDTRGNLSPRWTSPDDNNETYETAQKAGEHSGFNPYQWEVFEHWIVSDWLADKLEAHGEKVDRDFVGLTIWARTTTGQAISMDGVMERIAAELNAAA